jgi:1,2-diacylglycerol 3-alpha-glucosyltransferase
MTDHARPEGRNVAIVYAFFPHYRGAVMRQLLDSDRNRYILVADIQDPVDSGIKAWQDIDPSRFVRTRCRMIFGRFLLQSGLLRLVLRKDLDTFIYLGDAQFLTTWTSAAVARLLGKRVLFWTHGWLRPEAGIKDLVRRTFYHLANGLLLYGQRAKTMGISKGFREESLYVIFNSLDYGLQKELRNKVSSEELTALRRELYQEPDRPSLICVSRLIRSKRLDLILEAMVRLRQRGHLVNLVLVGAGPERENLAEMASRWDLPVVFYGECYDETKLARLIMSATVTVSPGAVGLTAMHSLAYGTPVITHDSFSEQGPEVEGIAPGLNGDFFEKGNPESLSLVIRKWTQALEVSDRVRTVCYEAVERYYNPWFQRDAIDQAVLGLPAQRIEEWYSLFDVPENRLIQDGFPVLELEKPVLPLR